MTCQYRLTILQLVALAGIGNDCHTIVVTIGYNGYKIGFTIDHCKHPTEWDKLQTRQNKFKITTNENEELIVVEMKEITTILQV